MKKFLSSTLAATLAFSVSSAAIIRVTSDVTTDTNWTNNNEYILTDIIYVRNNATLTIQAGTIVRGEPKSSGSSYDPGTLVVTRSGQIDAEGDATSPIIFTTAKVTDVSADYSGVVDYANSTFLDANPSGAPLGPGANFSTTAGNTAHLTDEYRGLWGGVIILGNAPTNIMNVSGDKVAQTNKTARADLDDIFEGFIEGLDPNDTGANYGVYGGSNPNDSSGTLKYVSIRHGGTNIAADNEINGLTMGGVGFGTLIEYVEVYCNDDDGFEWFGGTANCRYLISLYNNDDSFDIDEGFTGLGQFWFSLQIDDGTNGDHGGEHDGTNGAFDNADVDGLNGHTVAGTGDKGFGLPITYPTIFNATYVDAGTTEQMLKFEDSFGCNYYNSVFVGAESELVDASGTDMDDRISAADAAFVSNSIAYDIKGNTGALLSTDISNNAALATIIAANNNVLGGTNPFATLTSATVRTSVDPRVTTTANNAVTLASPTATYFIPASYAGAFDPVESDYWSDGWSVFSVDIDNK
jgi:hypothetical protein